MQQPITSIYNIHLFNKKKKNNQLTSTLRLHLWILSSFTANNSKNVSMRL